MIRSSALFRVDAAPDIGGGHVMRCLTLAKALSAAGWSVKFAIAEGTARVVPALPRAGFPAVTLQDPRDPEELRQHLPQPVNLLVIDHYGLDARYESRLRDCAKQILVIDDLVDRPHDCDFLLDQTFGRDAASYKPLVPPGAKVLAGATYALLRPEFAAAREKSLQRRQTLVSADRILISMGLTDLGGITAQVLDAVLDVCPGKAIDVVLGPSAPSLPAVQAAAETHPNVTLHIDTPSMPELMAAADLAIGAAGTTTWERCCLGLPTITMVLADNQVDLSRRLQEAGALVAAGDVSDIPDLLRSVLQSGQLRDATQSASAIIDGAGADRVVAALAYAASNRNIEVRSASEADVEALWKWRNDAETRNQSFSPDLISWPDHVRWYRSKLRSEKCRIYVGSHSGIPCGMVRLDLNEEGAAIISINLDAAYRRRGLGTELLQCAIGAAVEQGFCSNFVAEVKEENTRSFDLFNRSGFVAGRVTDGRFEMTRACHHQAQRLAAGEPQ